MGLESGPPLDLRKLRYFVVVAEELHFGRAAERLYVSQSVLSRQIRKLEQELATDLFKRTSRNVELTPAGLKLLDEARPLLSAADATRRRIGDIAREQTGLTIGFFIGDVFTAARKAFTAIYPGVAVNLLRIYWSDQTDVLHDGRADVAFLHMPVDDEGLQLMPVRLEPRVAVLWASHPAADKQEISIVELADDPVIIQRGASPGWQAFHNVDPRPDGREPRRGPEAGNLEEKLQHVAAGRAISFLPASLAAAFAQPGIVYVPVTDIPPIKVCLGWKAENESPLVADFAACVTDATRQPRDQAGAR
jgi:DNA-binding transcriptional LysR family regulator